MVTQSGLLDEVVVEHTHDSPCSIGCLWPQVVSKFRLEVEEPLHVKDFEGVQQRYAARSNYAALEEALLMSMNKQNFVY